METIGTRLEKERARLVMTQTDFATHIGLPQSSYNEYKSGKKKMSAEVLMNVAAALGWTPEYLFHGKGDKMNTARTFHEAQLLRLFRSIPKDQHETILGMVRVAADGMSKANEDRA